MSNYNTRKITTKEKADILDNLMYENLGIFIDSLEFSKYVINDDKGEYHYDSMDINTIVGRLGGKSRFDSGFNKLLVYKISLSSAFLVQLIENDIIKDGSNTIEGKILEATRFIVDADLKQHPDKILVDDFLLSDIKINNISYPNIFYIQTVAPIPQPILNGEELKGNQISFRIVRNGNSIRFFKTEEE